MHKDSLSPLCCHSVFSLGDWSGTPNVAAGTALHSVCLLHVYWRRTLLVCASPQTQQQAARHLLCSPRSRRQRQKQGTATTEVDCQDASLTLRAPSARGNNRAAGSTKGQQQTATAAPASENGAMSSTQQRGTYTQVRGQHHSQPAALMPSRPACVTVLHSVVAAVFVGPPAH